MMASRSDLAFRGHHARQRRLARFPAARAAAARTRASTA